MDASGHDIGAVRSQRYADRLEHAPANINFPSSEHNYSNTCLELLAVYIFVQQLEHFLKGKRNSLLELIRHLMLTPNVKV